MGKHARLAASKTKEWKAAPGIIALHEAFPQYDPSGEAAQMGTCVHELIERCLGENSEPSKYLDRIMEIVKPDTENEGVSMLRKGAKLPTNKDRPCFIMDEELVEAATCMTDYVRRRQAEMGDAELFLEERTNPLPERDDTGGSADVTLFDGLSEIELIDYKNGTGVLVPIENNAQTLTYLLGQVKKYLGGIEDDYTYRMTIVQPRHHRTPDDGVMSVSVSAQELREFEAELVEACERVDLGRGILEDIFVLAKDEKPAVEYCINALDKVGLLEVKELAKDGGAIWDPFLKLAPSNQRLAEEVMDIDFADDPEEGRNAELLAPEILGDILEWKPFIEKWLKDVAKEAENRLMKREEVPGQKLVVKMGNRTLKPDVDAKELKVFVKGHEGDVDKMYNDPEPPKLRTGVQIMNLLPKEHREEFEREFLYKPQGAPAMVPESDGRKAYVPADPAEDFDDE
ncbi:hypothetical protein P67b_00050 [Ruegeria phage Tedan]|nr:hypothetical protein P67b_00050 [Ruegeria phage Tedan]